jgi:hypothetical protein
MLIPPINQWYTIGQSKIINATELYKRQLIRYY